MTRRAALSKLGVAVLTMAALGVTATVPADAVSSVKKFSEVMRVDGGSAVNSAILDPGSTHTLHFDITNSRTSNQAFGSAQITVPTGFTVSSGGPTVAGPANFHVARNSVGFLLTSTGPTGTGIAPGATVSISASVTAPNTGVCNVPWTTQVKQSNDFSGSGNDFVGNSVTTSVGSNHLVFTTEPTDTEYDKTMADVVVTAEDPCGNTVGSFGGTVTLTDAFTPSKVATGSTATASSGVATFSNITFVNNDWGYSDSFTASAPPTSGYTSVVSDSFNVEQLITTCAANKTCSASGLGNSPTSGALNTLAGINVGTAGSTDTLRVSVAGDPNTQEFVQTCTQSQQTATGTTPRFYGTVVSLQINNRQKTVTMMLPKSYVLLQPTPNGTPFWDICLQSDTGFTDKFGNTPVTAGFLPDCPSVLPSPVKPCVLSRNKNAGNEIIKFVLPPGDPHAAWG